jgi:hypothetical protein
MKDLPVCLNDHLAGSSTLDVVLGSGAGLSGFDFAGLEKRAADQFGCVEAQTMEIARQIFTAESG